MSGKKDFIYLNNAATTFPKPSVVKDAVSNALENFASAGRGAGNGIVSGDDILLKTRDKIAKFISAPDPSRIAFTQNCTEALNYAIKGVLVEGDHVIMDGTVHNSVSRPLIALESEGIITLTKVNPNSDHIIEPSVIKSKIKENTKLVVISHASNVTGVIQDVKEIGNVVKESKALFLVDAAQSAGQIEINVEESHIDLLATAGHKSLYGPTGTGLVYVSKKINEIKTIKEGGTGSHSEKLIHPTELPYTFESGTHNIVGIAGLLAGIEFINTESLAKIRSHESKLTQALIDGLSSISGVKIYGKKNAAEITSVVSLTIDGYDVADCGVILADSFNLITRTGLHCASLAHEYLGTINSGGTLRISPGYFNTEEDIEHTIKAISEICN